MALTAARAGSLNRRVIIQYNPALRPEAHGKPGLPTDDYGAVNPGQIDWQTLRETWAQISPVKGTEALRSGREVAENWACITVAYLNAKDVDETMQIVDKATGAQWDIRSATELDTEHRLIEFTCRRVT